MYIKNRFLSLVFKSADMRKKVRRIIYVLGGALGGASASATFLEVMTYYNLASMEVSGYALSVLALVAGSSTLIYQWRRHHRNECCEYAHDA
jgi:hypothetical protein